MCIYMHNKIRLSQNNRGKRVRIFLNGDYEFLCHMFGLSGASGMPKSSISK